jgi:VanZ family protein
MNSATNRLWRYGPLLLWLGFIWFASTSQFSATNTTQLVRPILLWLFPNISEPTLNAVHFFTRKLGHFSEYAILAFFAHYAFSNSRRAFLRHNWFSLALFLIATNALLDEFHQSFVPSRTSSAYDSAIDLAGGLVILLIFKLSEKRRRETAPAFG